jgi:hypothetical protein
MVEATTEDEATSVAAALAGALRARAGG